MKDESRGKTKEVENHVESPCDDVGKGQRTLTTKSKTPGLLHLLTNLDTNEPSVTKTNCGLNCINMLNY